MRRVFFGGVAWLAWFVVAGLATIVMWSEAGRTAGAGQWLLRVGAVAIGLSAFVAFVKGRSMLARAKRMGMASSQPRATRIVDPDEFLAAATQRRRIGDASGPVMQLADAQSAIERMRLLCRTPETLTDIAARLGLELEPMRAQFSNGTGALVETAATGIGLIFFAPTGAEQTTLFADDYATWPEIQKEMQLLGIARPEWLSDPSDFPD